MKSGNMFFAALVAATVGIAAGGSAWAGKPFGDKAAVRFAGKLWQSLNQANLVGDSTIHTNPYEGQPPHGKVLETLYGKVTVNGRYAPVIVKKNYRGKEVTTEYVADEPDEFLRSITVMYKREKGYDSADKDWFWVKYAPNGKILKNPKGMALAGRVVKGAPKGCIACHQAAPGGDFVYNNDRYAK